MGLFDWLRGRRTTTAADPWARTSRRPCNCRFGPGRKLRFPEYLAGPSAVRAASVDAVRDWLSGCTYVPDQEQFGVSDYWQHPGEFEGRRRGDCEDFALWGWRKLVELGYDATLVVGDWDRPGGSPGRHAWVLLATESGPFLLDGTMPGDEMLRPLADLRPYYQPDVGADARGSTFTFHGSRCRR